MTIREQLELREIEYLSPYATLSKDVISDRYFKETGIAFCIVRHSEE